MKTRKNKLKYNVTCNRCLQHTRSCKSSVGGKYKTRKSVATEQQAATYLLFGGFQWSSSGHCQVSSVPHYCGFKEQEIPRIYTVWIVIYWNSNVNILIFWDTDFWLSLAVSSNHQNIYFFFKCFTFTCNTSKISERFTFLISYKKKWTFSPYSNFLRCTCILFLMNSNSKFKAK